MTAVRFLSPPQASALRERFGTPLYVYDQRTLTARARELLTIPSAFGSSARYAMKAAPNRALLQLFTGLGINIDASSGYEVERAIRAGVAAERIQLTAQELPENLADLVTRGISFNACSLEQLERFGAIAPGSSLSVRVNPGLGSGHNNRVNVGGPGSSFGIWHEQIGEVSQIAKKHSLEITALHSHIGAGTDPAVWQRCAALTLQLVKRIPTVWTVNLGGGFKVSRMPGEERADLASIGRFIAAEFQRFAAEDGRCLQLELEPGTYLVAEAGAILTSIVDIVNTGAQGYGFLKLDSGMSEILRPSLYGAQHWIELLPVSPRRASADAHDAARHDDAGMEYLVVGHCCESGDLLTPAKDNPEQFAPRKFIDPQIQDLIVIYGAGAYCSAMSAKNYNSFPEAPEVLLDEQGAPSLIRARQTLDQMIANELIEPG